MKTKNQIPNAKNTAQQGDITLIRHDSLPQGKSAIASKHRCVLAHGESGHSHVVEETGAELIQIGERMLLKLERAATVKHEEHKPFTLMPGIWEVGRVAEFDYLTGMTNPVRD